MTPVATIGGKVMIHDGKVVTECPDGAGPPLGVCANLSGCVTSVVVHFDWTWVWTGVGMGRTFSDPAGVVITRGGATQNNWFYSSIAEGSGWTTHLDGSPQSNNSPLLIGLYCSSVVDDPRWALAVGYDAATALRISTLAIGYSDVMRQNCPEDMTFVSADVGSWASSPTGAPFSTLTSANYTSLAVASVEV